jgi:hypothetical protein
MEDTMNKLFLILILSVFFMAIKIGCSGDSVSPEDSKPPINTVQVATVTTGLPNVSPNDTLWMPSDSSYEYSITVKDSSGIQILPAKLQEIGAVPVVTITGNAANASIVSRTFNNKPYYAILIVATGLTSDSLTERVDVLTLTVGNVTVKRTFVFQPNISRLNYHWVTVGNSVDGRGTQFIHNNGDYYASYSLSVSGAANSFRIRKNRPIPLSPGAILGNVIFPAINAVRPSSLKGKGVFGGITDITYVAEIRNY